jgi:hypothetical protein
MQIEEVVQLLCAEIPEAIGAIVCDYEGESVVYALGPAEPPDGAEESARSRIPRTLGSKISITEFLLRIAGAEPCSLLTLFGERSLSRGAGEIVSLDLRFEQVDLLIRRLPDGYYVMVALRRPALRGQAKSSLEAAQRRLTALIA